MVADRVQPRPDPQKRRRRPPASPPRRRNRPRAEQQVSSADSSPSHKTPTTPNAASAEDTSHSPDVEHTVPRSRLLNSPILTGIGIGIVIVTVSLAAIILFWPSIRQNVIGVSPSPQLPLATNSDQHASDGAVDQPVPEPADAQTLDGPVATASQPDTGKSRARMRSGTSGAKKQMPRYSDAQLATNKPDVSALPKRPSPRASQRTSNTTSGHTVADNDSTKWTVLPLPEWSSASSSSGVPVELAPLDVDNGDLVKMYFYTSPDSDRPAAFLIQKDDSAHAVPTWLVTRQARSAFAKQTQVARFLLQDKSLRFQWDQDVPAWAHPNTLRFQLLCIQAGNALRRYRLSEVQQALPIQINLEKQPFVAALSMTPNIVADPDTLWIDLSLLKQPVNTVFSPSRLQPGDQCLVKIPVCELKDGMATIDLTVRFEATDSQYALQFEATGIVPGLNKKGAYELEHRSINRDIVKGQRRQFQKDRKDLGKKLNDFTKKVAEYESLQKEIESALKLTDLSMRSATTTSSSYSSRSLQQSAQQRAELTRRQQLIEKELPRITAARDAIQQYLTQKETWCEKAADILRQCEEDMRVGYRLYLKIDEEEIDLLTTTDVAVRGAI